MILYKRKDCFYFYNPDDHDLYKIEKLPLEVENLFTASKQETNLEGWEYLDFFAHQIKQKQQLTENDCLRLQENNLIKFLPLPAPSEELDLIHAIINRRSNRNFSDKPISEDDFSTIIFYSAHRIPNATTASGICKDDIEEINIVSDNCYPYPCAGATNSLNVYVWASNIRNIEIGLYKYNTEKHLLEGISTCERNFFNKMFFDDAIWPSRASASILISGSINKRTYSNNYNFLHLEAGHLLQNIQLLSTSIGISSCLFGDINESFFLKLISEDDFHEILLAAILIGVHQS